MGLGFVAGEETVWLENGDGGRDGDFLRCYMAITLPQMTLSKIDGVVNLFSTRRAKETSNFRCMLAGLLSAVQNQIFRACWLDCSARCEIKFSGGQTAPSGQQRLEFRAALVVAFLVFL